MSEELVSRLLEDLVERIADRVVAKLQALGDAARASAVEHMSVAEYARHRRVSERTIRYQIKEMTEGVHYDRDGRRGRRVVVHVREADRWHSDLAPSRGGAPSLEQLAVDEVTRRRARAALKKLKGKT